MTEIISGSIYNEIRDKLTEKIDVNKLPLYSDKEIFKLSAESYGRVKVKLEIEDDPEILRTIKSYLADDSAIKVCYFTYKWEASESALPKLFEKYIKPEVEKFISLLSVFRKREEQILRVTIVDGGYKVNERPGHAMAVRYALIDLLKQM